MVDGHTFKGCTVLECPVLNLGKGLGKRHCAEAAAAVEGIGGNAANGGRELDGAEPLASGKDGAC